MKGSNKKGFTTVELVVVIAVIAILASALIVSLVVVNGKNKEIAEMQEQNMQKLEELKEIINSNEYLTAEDIQEKLEAVLSEFQGVSAADVEAAINKAILEHLQNNPSGSGMSEAEVRKIVAEAIKGMDTGLTKEEVKDLVNSILNGK